MNLPDIPSDREVFEGEIATYWFEGDILVARSKPVRRTVKLIAGNVELVKRISGGERVPLLIYLVDSPVPDKETRKFSAKMVPEIYSAMAMISRSSLARMIMRAVFALNKPPIPMRSFGSAEEAKKWLAASAADKR